MSPENPPGLTALFNSWYADVDGALPDDCGGSQRFNSSAAGIRPNRVSAALPRLEPDNLSPVGVGSLDVDGCPADTLDPWELGVVIPVLETIEPVPFDTRDERPDESDAMLILRVGEVVLPDVG